MPQTVANHKWVPLSRVLELEPYAAALGVSEVARAEDGFLREYERAKTARRMRGRLVPGYAFQTWDQRRAAFISRHLPQYRKKPSVRRQLALLMWAYDPDS
jgi:hypothetical protein